MRQALITFLAGLAEEVFGSQQEGKAPDSKQEVEKKSSRGDIFATRLSSNPLFVPEKHQHLLCRSYPSLERAKNNTNFVNSKPQVGCKGVPSL